MQIPTGDTAERYNAPPRLRRENNLLREWNKYTRNPNLPIHKYLSIPEEIQRLSPENHRGESQENSSKKNMI